MIIQELNHFSSHLSTPPPSCSLVVPRPLNAQIRRHSHILNNNHFPIPARHPHTRLRRSHPTRDLKEVVIRPLRLLPRFAAIDRHLKFACASVGIHDLRGEPVLRHAGFEVDGQRAGDGGAAVDELVGRVDDAFSFVGLEGRPGVFEEVEVAGVAFGAFVYDLSHHIYQSSRSLIILFAFDFLWI